ncbi:subtilisin family serine protease [Streptomyces sp. KhCrAH-43]|uniref:S8 family serine peptidase n=1 Tax=unclassified Streptomyces TaxID=2593676 RepID=UPI00036A2D75|nr:MULTISPECIES: S8 family serine peptidase [unclassified Streptomyces]MYS35616.1 S8 family serine peptidase [Streptomyces sp. SID4920]MYX68693.1 S8 family serine peptidase [Streptomyces sp. SID8373]RAJ55081.1 subtilisin family serine protease [Streptomyces sp. KhCrAH-43]
MHLSRSPRRRTAAWAAAALTVTGLLIGPPSAAAADGPAAPVDSALLKAVDKGGETSFFVVLKDKADLTTAQRKRGHAARAKSAFDELRAKAHKSQQSLNTFLDEEKVGHQDFWIANAVKVTGDQDLVERLAMRPDVARIVKEQHYKLDDIDSKPTAAETKAAVKAATKAAAAEEATPEWGVEDIKADRVWDDYKDRGEGIVIANVDSGVQFDHPDLVDNYRGNNGDGSFTHDYNWYDASGECPTSAPCDNNGHGTHTMGTMVGKGGVGVAPNATWIAAKGCESNLCNDSTLLLAGQWILAPTDHNGQNPRPDLAPNIVNNSWGADDTTSTFYQDIVEAWNSAGIFEAFAAGNDGDGATCSTTHPPGSQVTSYGVGAYDSKGKIANFSGFGPSLVDGSMKPNISAPGVDVRSTWPGNAYNTISGTSMATPHVAGAVALLWSAAPSLIGDIDGTRALLNDGAIDVDDTHCGGTADANNVWGEGKLDIFASVDKAPHTAATVTGTVTDATTGKALTGLSVKATDAAGTSRIVNTVAGGAYRLTLAEGTYSFTLSGYGYAPKTVTGIQVTKGEALTQDFTLDAVDSHRVSGTVLDVQGRPLARATVTVDGSPIASVKTDTSGAFTLPEVSEGDYTLSVTPSAPVLCNGAYHGALTVDGDETAGIKLPALSDAYGNTCAPATYSWIKGTTDVALTGDEDARTIALPFPVKHYGVAYTSASVTTNGLVNFLEPRIGDYANTALPSAARPNGTVAVLWDDLVLDKKSTVQTAVTGAKGKRSFAIVWNKAAYADGTAGRATFEAVFDEATGSVTVQFKSVPDRGTGATVGIENQTGTDALQYSFDQSVITAGSAVHFTQEDK